MEEGLSHNCVNDAIADSKGFIWIATGEGLNRYDGHSVKNFLVHTTEDEKRSHSNSVFSLLEDKNGDIWVGTLRGIYRFDTDKEKFIRLDAISEEGNSVEEKVTDIAQGKNGDIWIADYSKGVFKYEVSNNKLICYSRENGKINSNEVLSLCCDLDSTLWAGSIGFNKSGLSRYDELSDSFITYEHLFKGGVSKISESSTNNLFVCSPINGLCSFNRITERSEPLFFIKGKEQTITDVLEEKDNLWIGTTDGLYIKNKTTGKISHFESSSIRDNSLTSNDITNILMDHNGGLWFSTLSKGINYLPDNWSDFEFYPSSEETASHGQIKHFSKDSEGNIWFVSDRGISVFRPKDGNFNAYPLGKTRLSGDNITLIEISDNRLWVGYMARGLDQIDLKTQSVFQYPTIYTYPNSLNDNSIISLCKDTEGNLIVGTTKGANIISSNGSTISTLLSRDHNIISDIIEDEDMNLWLSSAEDGVFVYNPRIQTWKHYINDPNDDNSLCCNNISGLFKDTKGNIWMLTEGNGVCRYSTETQRFRTFTITDGLPNNIIQKMLEDNSGNIWISTNNGLSCFCTEDESFTNYSFSGGPLSNQFIHNSGIKDDEGYLMFGTNEGFLRFNPEKLKPRTTNSSIYFTDLFVNNQIATIGEKTSPLEHSIVNSDKIIIRHNQNSFRLSISSMDMRPSQRNQFVYKLEGYDQKWIIAHNNQIYYSNLPNGKYKLVVEKANNPESRKSIMIFVLPSPWRSWWAKSLYFLLFIGIVSAVFWSIMKRQKERKKYIMEEIKANEEKVLYDTKLAFFTGIAHEIKTPLSLISAPFEILSSPESTIEDKNSCMEVMHENLERLTALTKQMLDLSITEQGGYKINKVPTDLNNLIGNVLKTFKISLQQNDIHIYKHLCKPHLVANVDNEEYAKIVSNLLSNASKYCRGIIRLSLTKKGDIARLSVWNNGPPIGPEFREKIFEPFFQIPGNQKLGGVGVGLSLVKSFVEIHRGKVYVNPDTEDGTEFVVEIPIGVCSTINEPENTEAHALINETVPRDGKMTVLVVDDNKSMTQFLKKLLSRQYHIITALDGSSAISLLRQSPVDLVISDVMMSDIDGISLCKVIKNHDEFRHIPVILLTAKTDLKSKVAGMDAGAEAYIEKPFSTQLLMAQIHNIIRNKRSSISIGFSKNIAPQSTLTAKDERLMKKLYDTVEYNLSNQELSVNMLCDELHISRSYLYRKIKEKTNLSPGKLIKKIRLEKAAAMLRNSDLRIGEIGYLVGYNSSSYFAKSFLKEYGTLPKDYAKLTTKDENNE
jgi:ligand-binding sensor domain-containing protein/DNA-binding response OmpR family regulator/nitrogen-specific signal transduction histidine kinase